MNTKENKMLCKLVAEEDAELAVKAEERAERAVVRAERAVERAEKGAAAPVDARLANINAGAEAEVYISNLQIK